MIDSHQHFWEIDRGDYSWMGPHVQSLLRDFMPDDLRRDMKRAGITCTIVVQAAETEAETDFLLELAAETDFIAGVIGWLDMNAADFGQRLEHYTKNPFFLGIRPMLQDLPDDEFILRPQVLNNLRHMAAQNVPLDILTFTRHLPVVAKVLQQVPDLRAVVDHISKPEIALGKLDPWRDYIAEIANFPNISCKVSGMVTEAAPDWRLENFRPYIDHVAAHFGADRLMFGSDWPVCTLAASYAEVNNLARTLLGCHFGPDDMNKIFKSNVARFYGVPVKRYAPNS
eukprot:gene13495-13609_t